MQSYQIFSNQSIDLKKSQKQNSPDNKRMIKSMVTHFKNRHAPVNFFYTLKKR
jgi:hypothetical protein